MGEIQKLAGVICERSHRNNFSRILVKIQIIFMIVVKGKFSNMNFSLAPLNPIILSPILPLMLILPYDEPLSMLNAIQSAVTSS